MYLVVDVGPRRSNSYVLHEDRSYNNPYPVNKKQDPLFSSRSGLPLYPKIDGGSIKFNSDFECGNLDVVVRKH